MGATSRAFPSPSHGPPEHTRRRQRHRDSGRWRWWEGPAPPGFCPAPLRWPRPGAALGNDLSGGEAQRVVPALRRGGRGARAPCPPSGLRARGRGAGPAGGSPRSFRTAPPLPLAGPRTAVLPRPEGRSKLGEVAGFWRSPRSSFDQGGGIALGEGTPAGTASPVIPLPPSLKGRLQNGAQELGILSGQGRVPPPGRPV